jgi:hypothetical protein
MSILFALVLAAEVAGPNVTLPLAEYEKLRQLRERPSVTVVDLLRVEGSFGRRDLGVTIQGRASGTQPTTEVLGGEGFRLYGCTGEALVTRAESGNFALTPLAPRFEARCRIALDGSDRLEATALAAVLEVASAVADGELVSSGAGGDRAFSIVRRLSGGDAVLPPSIAGRYKVTLLPEESRFLYRFEVRNPNRGRHRFAIPLREAEHVESVNAPVAWDKEGGAYRFDLPPGESTIELTGRLTGSSFAPPVEASLQYLLLESHPLIRAEVAGTPKRVGVGEVGLCAEYRGAQAFLLDARREVGWKVVRLEALKTAGLAISNLEQIYFMGAARDVRGETRLAIDNQGAPAIELPVQGEPTFASIAGEAAFLTLDQAGRLFLPLGQGEQAVVVQSKRMFRSALGFAAVALELPGLGAPASQASVELRYPPEWIPFYEELSPESRLGLLDGRDLTLLAILAVLTERLLALLQIRLRRRIPLAGALVLAAAFASPIYRVVFLVAALCYLAVAAALLARRFSGARLAGALAALAALAFFGTLVGSMLVEGILPTAAHYEARRLAEEPVYAASAPMADNVLRKSKGPEEMKDATSGVAGVAAPPAAYQGLPARIELPRGVRQTVFRRQLLATDEPRRVFVLLASSRLVALLTWVTALLALGLVMRSRRELAQGARDLITRLRAPLPKEQP